MFLRFRGTGPETQQQKQKPRDVSAKFGLGFVFWSKNARRHRNEGKQEQQKGEKGKQKTGPLFNYLIPGHANRQNPKSTKIQKHPPNPWDMSAKIRLGFGLWSKIHKILQIVVLSTELFIFTLFPSPKIPPIPKITKIGFLGTEI